MQTQIDRFYRHLAINETKYIGALRANCFDRLLLRYHVTYGWSHLSELGCDIALFAANNFGHNYCLNLRRGIQVQKRPKAL